jgi:hypothetical protein
VIMEVYSDDIMVKSAIHTSHFANMCLAFERMRQYGSVLLVCQLGSHWA